MRLVTDGQLFTVLAAQVLSPLTISPRVSLCSSVLSNASESVLPQHLDWGSSTLLVVLEAVFQNRLHPLLPPFIFCLLKRCAQCMNSIVCLILPGGLLDLLLLIFFFVCQVVYNVGLCICLYDITKLEDSYIFPGDGASHTKGKCFSSVILCCRRLINDLEM